MNILIFIKRDSKLKVEKKMDLLLGTLSAKFRDYAILCLQTIHVKKLKLSTIV